MRCSRAARRRTAQRAPEPDPCPPVDQRGVHAPAVRRLRCRRLRVERASSGGGGGAACTGRTERPVPADFDSWISQSAAELELRRRLDPEGELAERRQPARAHPVHVAGDPARLPARRGEPAPLLLGGDRRPHARRAAHHLGVERVHRHLGEPARRRPAPAAGTDSGLDVRTWDVLEQALAMYEHGSHGFLIRDRAEDGAGAQSFHSREKGADRPPELVLVFDDPDAPPQPGSCSDVRLKLAADRDSWVNEGSPTNNFGNDSTLKIKSQSGLELARSSSVSRSRPSAPAARRSRRRRSAWRRPRARRAARSRPPRRGGLDGVGRHVGEPARRVGARCRRLPRSTARSSGTSPRGCCPCTSRATTGS